MDLNVFVSLSDSDATKDHAIEELQKQINDIVDELNLLKERQALQTGERERRTLLSTCVPPQPGSSY